jgi:hypothetical protein
MFREPIRVGSRSIPVRVSLGACLQHDAPKADAARGGLAPADRAGGGGISHRLDSSSGIAPSQPSGPRPRPTRR